MDNRTEPLGDGVWRIEASLRANAYLVDSGEGLTLVDPGPARSAPRVVRSVRLLGLDPRAIGEVILTHWHAGRAGGAAAFAASSAAPAVRALPPDADVVAGDADPAPPHRPRAPALAQRLLRRPEPTAVAPLTPGQTVAGGRAEVVPAPGHTRGHAALWLADAGVLLAGDAARHGLRLARGRALLAEAPEAAAESLATLAALGPSVVGCGQGPPLRRRAAERLAALVGPSD